MPIIAVTTLITEVGKVLQEFYTVEFSVINTNVKR